ncbi:hypothetical protein BGZ76_007926 [Entomortierella beljakovae]|nr:hypothetical protein BGZ76_007926 [Entomortierella beljakovae]
MSHETTYIVKDAPGKGKGMFASRNIKKGECIISEEPLVYVGPDAMKTLNSVSALNSKNKKSFYSLHNAHADTLPELGITRTNALPLGEDAIEGAVYRVISRINHSCAPNCRHSWNSMTKKEYVYAVCDIDEGDEILTSYIDPLAIHEDRRRKLFQNFKFKCQCSVCVASSREYDMIVTRINTCSDLILECAQFNPKLSIKFVREAVGLLDKIGVARKTAFYYDGYQISAMYSDYKLAQEWANLLVESYRMEEGEGDQYQRYLRYSKYPRSHERAGCVGMKVILS